MYAVLDSWLYHETMYKSPQLKVTFTMLIYINSKKPHKKPAQNVFLSI